MQHLAWSSDVLFKKHLNKTSLWRLQNGVPSKLLREISTFEGDQMDSRAISPWALGPRTLGPMYPKSQGPRGRGPEVLGILGPRPSGPWDLKYLGLKVRGPKVQGPRAQGLMALESTQYS